MDVYHVGDFRRTDWLPVGEDPDGHEQLRPGVESDSNSEEPESEENFGEDCGESDEDADEFGDFGAGEESCGFRRFDDSGDELGEEAYPS